MKINFTNFQNNPYRFRFNSWQIIAALICAVGICILNVQFEIIPDFKYFAPQKSDEIKPDSIVINGFENLSKHRIFEKPKTPLDKRIIMLGACQVSSLHWDYTPEGFDSSGRSSLPYLMEKELQKNPATSNVYVYNLGMEGTGYLEAFYFLLSVLEQPNIRLVVLSISQEGDTHIPDDSRSRFSAYSQFLPKMETMLKFYHAKYPEIIELHDYYEYVENHPWTVAGHELKNNKDTAAVHVKGESKSNFIRSTLSKATAFLEYNGLSRSLKFHSREISENTGGILSELKEWLGIQTALKNNNVSLKPETWYIENFQPRAYTVTPRTFARYTKRDEAALRAMSKLLARKKIDFWVHNPADLAVRMNSLVNDRWWKPLKESLSDLPNVKTIDMSCYPIENGIDTAGRVAPTYFGSLKTMKAFIPYVQEWNKND